jgi:uncharacterized protein (TIGR02246 family)
MLLPPEESIREVVKNCMDAWNRHDAKAFASLFAIDADLMNWMGQGATGREAIERAHELSFATRFKTSHQTTDDIKVRLIKTDVASVDIWWNMTGALDGSGQPRPPRRGILSWVMTKEEGKWLIKVMHNLDLTAIIPTRQWEPGTAPSRNRILDGRVLQD